MPDGSHATLNSDNCARDSQMKAVVRYKYGSSDVLQLEELQKPTPGDDEVLLKIHASSVNRDDWELLTGDPFLYILLYRLLGPPPRLQPQPLKRSKETLSATFRFLQPRYMILGCDVAGRVEAVGKDVRQFQPGDEIFGEIFGFGLGAFAEYLCVPERAALVPKPASITFEQAAAVPHSAILALQGLRNKGQLQPGQNVLINGAGGGVGTFAVQLANYFGAEVTGVDSAEKLDMLRALGAHQVFDYKREDFTRSGKLHDLILDVAAYRSLFDYRRVLAPGGVYVMVGGSVRQLLQVLLLGPWFSISGDRKMSLLPAEANKEDLVFLTELLETGEIQPIIDRSYPLSETADALRYLGEGRTRGKVVITM